MAVSLCIMLSFSRSSFAGAAWERTTTFDKQHDPNNITSQRSDEDMSDEKNESTSNTSNEHSLRLVERMRLEENDDLFSL